MRTSSCRARTSLAPGAKEAGLYCPGPIKVAIRPIPLKAQIGNPRQPSKMQQAQSHTSGVGRAGASRGGGARTGGSAGRDGLVDIDGEGTSPSLTLMHL